MAQEIAYVNTMKFEAGASSLSRKRKISATIIIIMTILALLVLLLATSLIAMALLYSQKEKKLQEIEGVMEKIRTSLWLSNISLSPAEASESVQLLQNISEAFSKIQTRLGNVSASKTAVQNRHRDLLALLSKGWRFYNGNAYFLSQEAKPWKEAEDTCRAQEAHLVSITSKEEMEYLAREARKQPFWIGLSDQNTEGVWTWVDSTKYDEKLSFWGPRQPDNWHGAPQHKEDCVHVTTHWNDVSCTYNYKWFCKKVLS
ncbi:C-type lectin domain family 4 member F-like [Zootoca vivipara]|uniref:C-type lectin domain family 4 member F-like n=1 Tax=Zootoca vivipara TaxID=8524 RepID=UPI00159066BD|nr:C-type lectin domain family 4 member F-like [Zootoca vivipara]